MPRSKGCLDKKLCRGLLGDGMKSRRDILKSTKAILLGGTLLAVMAPAMPAMAADEVVTKAPVSATISDSIWESRGVIDVGTNIFIDKPPSGFGRIPTDPFWLTPTTDSKAKDG